MHYNSKERTLLRSKTGSLNEKPALVGRQTLFSAVKTAAEAENLLP